MADDGFRNSWRLQSEGHDRLRWARVYWQKRANAVNPSATDAATSLGMNANTYRAYERGPGSSKFIPLDHQAAIRFGRRFQVSWIWLLTGEGTPFDEDLPPQQARVVTAMAQISEDDQAVLADMVEAFLRRKAAG